MSGDLGLEDPIKQPPVPYVGVGIDMGYERERPLFTTGLNPFCLQNAEEGITRSQYDGERGFG